MSTRSPIGPIKWMVTRGVRPDGRARLRPSAVHARRGQGQRTLCGVEIPEGTKGFRATLDVVTCKKCQLELRAHARAVQVHVNAKIPKREVV